jgi:hypothetical protein
VTSNRNPDAKPARAIQKVSGLRYTEALEWVRRSEREITELARELKVPRRRAAVLLWERT